MMHNKSELNPCKISNRFISITSLSFAEEHLLDQILLQLILQQVVRELDEALVFVILELVVVDLLQDFAALLQVVAEV